MSRPEGGEGRAVCLCVCVCACVRACVCVCACDPAARGVFPQPRCPADSQRVPVVNSPAFLRRASPRLLEPELGSVCLIPRAPCAVAAALLCLSCSRLQECLPSPPEIPPPGAHLGERPHLLKRPHLLWPPPPQWNDSRLGQSAENRALFTLLLSSAAAEETD